MRNVPGLIPGDAQTFQSYDKPWASLSNTPFRLFKHFVHEGGVSTPAVVHWPDRKTPTGNLHAACHVVDILPTILEVTGTPHLAEVNDQDAQPIQGESLLGLLTGRDWQREQPIYFEHEGNSAIRMGQFKLVRVHGCDWELYDMEADRTELTNIIHGEADRASGLIRQYHDWAGKAGVLPLETLLPNLLLRWGLQDHHG